MHTSLISHTRLEVWNSHTLQQATQGQWLNEYQPNQDILRIVTDSRQIRAGDAFLALKGLHFDAHDFIDQAVQQGACCVIVHRIIDHLTIPQLVVKDTRLALGHLGAYRRQECSNLKVVALTGSSGKTTTKEMLGSILTQVGETLITRGNLNNDLGVPLMLLELRQDHRYAVFELGANHLGEIGYTAHLVQPCVAGVLNIGTAHMGEFGGREKICQAKAEIYEHLDADGIALYPAYDDFAINLQQASSKFKQYAIGLDSSADIYAKNIQLLGQSSIFDVVTPKGTVLVHLPFVGLHNVMNALNAIGFALALDIDLATIQKGLKVAKGAKGRLNFIEKHNVLLIDDTYNANPTSMHVAADVLCQQEKQIKIMVIGDIGELGENTISEHQALGQDLANKPLDYIISVGEYAQYVKAGAQSEKVIAYSNQESVITWLQQQIQPSTTYAILFKGSRYTHMENVLNALLESL